MPDPQGLNIHDIRQSEQTLFLPDGTTTRQTIVNYSIGTHGPFTLTFAQGTATADAVTAAIQAQQADLRQILQLEQNVV